MIENKAFKMVIQEEKLNQVAFPLGGIGAGMICLEGTGAFSNVSLRHRPDVFNEPLIFSALTIKNPESDNLTLILEGKVPKRKIFGNPGSGNGLTTLSYGMPRFRKSNFSWEFPFARIELSADDCPLRAELTAWSPFIPGDSDNSSLPVAAIEYTFSNPTDEPIDAVYSFNARNFLKIPDGSSHVKQTSNSFILVEKGSEEEPYLKSSFSVACDDPDTKINPSWFRGAWFDPLTIAWQDINSGECPCRPEITDGDPSPGATLYVPVKLQPGTTKSVCLKLAWFTPTSDLRLLKDPGEEPGCECDAKKVNRNLPTYEPWYAGKFKDIDDIAKYWQANYPALKDKTKKFSECLYGNTLPEKLLEAVTANLTILKSPTVLRQFDGRLWCWEGCCDARGCCAGTCTHVWNYAQALPHLFPDLERSLRQTEFNESQDERGHQNFRAALPIRPVVHEFHAASDGQLGGIMKVYREWRISNDFKWLKEIWPKVKQSLDYCIETWDPDHLGVLVEPHHNTYDIEFWGPDGMCSSFYLGALKAATMMAEALNDDNGLYSELYSKGRCYLETELYNGEYFIQKIQWKGLRAGEPANAQAIAKDKYSPEAIALLEKEGPKYQYGDGCLSDGVLGAWMAEVCGVGEILDPEKVKSHLRAIHKYNLKHDLSRHVNPQRPGYAVDNEGGLLLCSWPRGESLSLPFVYSNEVWTGIEYQVASHLVMFGCVNEGMEIVETARARYDGTVRNPFNEYECGHWYARAMSSYALIQGITGIRYDAVDKVLYIDPQISGDFSSFLCTATGYGTVGIRNGKPFVEIADGKIEIKEIKISG